MKNLLLPDKIYSNVENGKVSKAIAAEQLISLIEGSDNPTTRAESIKISEKLKIHDKKIFKILENSLLSDESPLVRKSAANFIGLIFLKKGLNSLIWVVQHDKSPQVLKVISDLNSRLNNTRFKSLRKEINAYLVEIALSVGIVQNEAKFILDLEALFAQNETDYELELKTYQFYKKLKDNKLGESWLTIRNKRIEALSFNYYNWKYLKEIPSMFDSISELQDPMVYLNFLGKLALKSNEILKIPDSLARLTNLKKLNLSRNNIKEFPKSILSLSYLKYLDISHNKISDIPMEIKDLNSLDVLRISHNQIRRIPDFLREFLLTLHDFKI
jgi:Leucine-rich repeat (LRR) protein